MAARRDHDILAALPEIAGRGRDPGRRAGGQSRARRPSWRRRREKIIVERSPDEDEAAGGGERAAEGGRADVAGEAERIEFLGRAERDLPQDLAAPEVECGQDAIRRRVAGQSERRDPEARAY